MRSLTPVLPIGAAAPVGALTSLLGTLSQALKAFARARQNRRAAMALSGLDRSMLKDIGLTRADINDAFSTPFWEDPTAILHERAIERRLNRTLARKPSQPRATPAQSGFTRPALDRPSRQAV
jgi:uncharacterized protein YjiS (DUF1127 family)